MLYATRFPILPLLSCLVAPALFGGAACNPSVAEPQPCDIDQSCNAEPPRALGALVDGDRTHFGIWSPDRRDVVLVLDGVSHRMQKAEDTAELQDVYQVTIQGNQHGVPYHFLIGDKVVRDPYARMAVPNENDAIVIDPAKVELEGGWTQRPALAAREDAIIYEMHVRDYTISPTSAVADQYRGKFLGLTEALPAGPSQVVDHLKSLGVTHVQLMPSYDFASCPDVEEESCYNWGYDPRNFNVPEERYSTRPYDYEGRIVEFKTMVDAFHREGIRVVMDVVYNHTFSKEAFENISESYYTETDLSGTGNSIDATNPMVARMIQDSLEYWVREYNIDGFRFDLVGIFDYETVGTWARHLEEQFPDRTLLLYGEPWNGYANDPRESERVRLGTVGRIADTHFGVFNPSYREAIKGQNDNGECNPGDCYAFNREPDMNRILSGVRGSLRASNNPQDAIDTWDRNFALDPEQSINYVSAHDNLSLRDKILHWAEIENVPADSAYLRRIQMFANGIILTSQGIPFLHGGVEMMRDKKGDENSYRSGDDVNQIDWNWATDNADVLTYYRDLIAIRKAHPAFRLQTWQSIQDNLQVASPAPGLMVATINGAAVGDSWSEILVIYNSGNNEEVDLPKGTWKVAAEKSDPSAGNDREVTGTVIAEGTAVTILHR